MDKLDTVEITKQFDVAEAISAIQFYWNLARQRNEVIIVEIGKKTETEVCHEPTSKFYRG